MGGGEAFELIKSKLINAKRGITPNAYKCVQLGGRLENRTFSAYALNGWPVLLFYVQSMSEEIH